MPESTTRMCESDEQANYLLIGNSDVETAVGSAGHSVTVTDQGYADEQGAVSDGCLRITRTVAGRVARRAVIATEIGQ